MVDDNSYRNLLTSYININFASMHYLLDNDPKLLNKVKLREKIYDWIKEKIKTPILSPQPAPIPVESYSILGGNIN